MKFRLWGTRGSLPSPLRSEEIEDKIQTVLSSATEAGVDLSDPVAVRAFVASLPPFIRGTAGGDTSCLEVRSAGNLLIFDCGSGIRRLGLELMKEEFGRGKGVAHIFIAHTHWDHMMGWPFFNPSYVPGNKFYIYGVHSDLEDRFRLQQTAPSMFPIDLDFPQSTREFITLQEGETVQIGRTRVSNCRFHHPGRSYGYRVEDDDGTFIYSGDGEFKVEALVDEAAVQPYVDFFRDADVLVFDAMFSQHDSFFYDNWGHSSAIAGAQLATRAGVRRLLLFHHAPTSNDPEIWRLRDEAEKYIEEHPYPDSPPCEIAVAYDGFEMEIWSEAKLETQLERLPEGIVVHLDGRLVKESAPIAQAAIKEAFAQKSSQPTPVVADLTDVVHVDQDGLKALLEVRRYRCPFALSGLSSELQRTFSKSGALGYFAIFDTVPQALSSLNQRVSLRIGQVLNNRYKIAEKLNPGPLGSLYRATDQANNQLIIIQVLCPSLGPLYIETLLETAQATTHLQHPLIAKTLDVGQDGSIQYLTLEHTRGHSVRQLIDASGAPTPISAEQVVYIGSQIAQALEHAHGQGIVHGALKPEHIFLDRDKVQVSHFGIGRPDVNRPLTELPAYAGPLDYLAPEQIQGRGNSPASDLYALGTILYEMLTGSPPFVDTTNNEDLIKWHLSQPPVPPRRRNANLSRSLEYLVLALLQKSPQERPRAAGVVRQLLNNLSPQPQRRSPLGRDEIRQKLYDHLRRVAQGQSGFLVVHGQKGIGKSQLALSITEQVANQSLITLHGGLYAHEDSRPYKLFVEALRRTLPSLPAHHLKQLLDDLGDLAHPLTALIPDLQSVLSAFVPSQISSGQLEEALRETLRLLATKGPVLLILDDLQWIDVASLRLLDQLARQRIPRLLIVALYRTEAVDLDHPLRQTLDALEAQIDEQIDVTPLNLAEVHQTISHLGDVRIPTDFGLWLYGETKGNLLFVEQLIQAYLEGPGPYKTGQTQERVTVTTLEDVILRRLERLPSDTLMTLRQAAILGHTFHVKTLRLALDQPEKQVMANLYQAFQAWLIFGHPTEDYCRFSHPLIREVIYDEMLENVRKRYHRRAARVLEPKGALGLTDERVDPLAHHFVCAEEHSQALVYLARASRRARELCAYDTAINYIDQALMMVDQLTQRATEDREREHRINQRKDLLNARAKLEAAFQNH